MHANHDVVNLVTVIKTSVSNGSRWPASGPGLDRIIASVRFQTRPKTPPGLSWRVCYPDRT